MQARTPKTDLTKTALKHQFDLCPSGSLLVQTKSSTSHWRVDSLSNRCFLCPLRIYSFPSSSFFSSSSAFCCCFFWSYPRFIQQIISLNDYFCSCYCVCPDSSIVWCLLLWKQNQHNSPIQMKRRWWHPSFLVPCFTCFRPTPFPKVARRPNTPLQHPERAWCGTCDVIISSSGGSDVNDAVLVLYVY